MGTEVLRPQDCLIQRFRPVPPTFLPRRKPNPNLPPKPSRKPPTRPEAKKRREGSPKPAKNDTVMGRVTILKRGESLDAAIKKLEITEVYESDAVGEEDLVVFGTGRLGPDPEMIPKQIRPTDLSVLSDVYAGSAFDLSPSPSSLPLPTFSMKKDGSVIVDHSATKDLRRLLRLV